MDPIPFKAQNIVYAEDQPEYIPLPVHKAEDGKVTSVWKLSDEEREKVAKGAYVCLCQSTFHQALQPVNLWVDDEVVEFMKCEDCGIFGPKNYDFNLCSECHESRRESLEDKG